MTEWWGWLLVAPITAFGLCLIATSLVDRKKWGDMWPIPFMFGCSLCFPFVIAVTR